MVLPRISNAALKERLDKAFYTVFSSAMIGFSAFRPMGVGVDDFGYAGSQFFEMTCPTLSCGKFWQGDRDQLWYSVVGLLRSFYPHPEVVLYLSALGLSLKLWIIARLTQHRSLALLFYAAIFYIIHDITALRVSFAIAGYLLAFYWMTQSRWMSGGVLIAVNGFFHKQAFVAPLLFLGSFLPWNERRAVWAILFPFILLVMGVYLGDPIFQWVTKQAWGPYWLNTLFGESYVNGKVGGGYDQTRLWPVVAPPTLILASSLIRDLFEGSNPRLARLTASSLFLAALFLWGYAVIPEVQLRFWHFFLVPMVFLVGNIRLNAWKTFGIVGLSAIYLLKYTVQHDLLLDQRTLLVLNCEGGTIDNLPPAISCGPECGVHITQHTPVTLRATPLPGYRFLEWQEACSGAEADCSFELDQNQKVGAKFIRTHDLAVKKTGEGTVLGSLGDFNCGPLCKVTLDQGTEIELSAQAAEGYRFGGWSGACEGLEPHCNRVLNASQSIEAIFIKRVTLKLLQDPGGRVTSVQGNLDCPGTCEVTLDMDSRVDLEASALPGFRFKGFEGACSGEDPACGLSLSAPMDVFAHFEPIPEPPPPPPPEPRHPPLAVKSTKMHKSR